MYFVYRVGEIKIWRLSLNIYEEPLRQVFARKKALIAYITLGDPSVEKTFEYCASLIESGVDILEIGIPFSDPIADGPVIQASHQRALLSNEDVTLKQAFSLIQRLKQHYPDTPITIMSAINLVMQYGVQQCFSDAKQHGCDGFILPDCSIEMADDFTRLAKEESISLVHLISPLCTKERMKNIVEQSTGFLYVISSTGITGERENFANNLSALITNIKKVKDIPVAVGFGVSSKEQVDYLHSIADAVIVGSYLVNVINKYEDKAATHLADSVKQLIES